MPKKYGFPSVCELTYYLLYNSYLYLRARRSIVQHHRYFVVDALFGVISPVEFDFDHGLQNPGQSHDR